MKSYDIDILKRNKSLGDIYDLTEKTFAFFSTRLFEYTVLPEEEMRIDLISYNIYKSTDYIDVILNVNEIINPLNILAGDKLIIPERANINNFRIVPPTPPLLRPSLVNTGRANIKDPKRLEFIENNFQLAPSTLPIPQSPIQVNRDNIVIFPIR